MPRENKDINTDYSCSAAPGDPIVPNPFWCEENLNKEFLDNLSFNYIYVQPELNAEHVELKIIIKEPYSFSWIAIAIAEGILSRTGSAIYDTVFGSDNDIERIIDRVITDFSGILGHYLNEQTDEAQRRDGNADLETAKVNLEEYSYSVDRGAPNVTPLNAAIQNIRHALGHYSQISYYMGTGAYMIAAGLEVSCLIELNKIDQENFFFKERAKTLHKKAADLIPKICRTQQLRYSKIERQFDPEKAWYYIDKGTPDEKYEEKVGFGAYNRIVDHRCQSMRELLQNTELERINPIYKLMASWASLYAPNPNQPVLPEK